MVGEVRDQETAQICLRAALTGHFVLSTIHTNDSLSAVTRLMDMGIEPFLLASTLRVLEAQRLVRRLCKHCKEPLRLRPRERRRGTAWSWARSSYRPKGCDACRGTGYRGRVGIFEVIRITPLMAKLIQSRTPLPEMREAAVSEGMKLLVDSAVDKAARGPDQPRGGAERHDVGRGLGSTAAPRDPPACAEYGAMNMSGWAEKRTYQRVGFLCRVDLTADDGDDRGQLGRHQPRRGRRRLAAVRRGGEGRDAWPSTSATSRAPRPSSTSPAASPTPGPTSTAISLGVEFLEPLQKASNPLLSRAVERL